MAIRADLLVAVLTVFSVVVVIGTYARLRGSRSAWLWVHTVFGLLGTVVWVAFLVAPSGSRLGSSLAGVIGLGCWWVVVVAGFALGGSARPGGGRRVAGGDEHRSAAMGFIVRLLGWLLRLAVLALWAFNTWAYALRKV